MDTLANNMSNLPEERGWEYKQISVTRVPGYGFGIAVSGGRDNPHFASGDPSIAVSDVLVAGPAERTLQVNDRIISVNGVSLQNVDYATAVQVLRDSGDTVTLVVKRRTALSSLPSPLGPTHQHSPSYTSPPPPQGCQPAKITLTKNSKKEDFGIVLGCKLFVKEISTKARDQLLATNQYLVEGDFITRINSTSCQDVMSLKEAKKLIDNCKDKLQLTVARDVSNNAMVSHQAQSSVSTTGAVNSYYKGDEFLAGQSYSNQNLYVQPPTRNPNLNSSNGFLEEKLEPPPVAPEDKSNLAPRGRLRAPLSDASLSQLDRSGSGAAYGKRPDEPPRPPPPRPEDYYSSRRQLYDEDPLMQKTKQSVPDARFITFQKEGSVGIRLTGGNYVGIFVTAVQPGSPASLQGLQPGDKILKVNDMDMGGVTREEAVLFLLSLQDRIELIVQFCKEEYDSIVASQRGDSFYIKTHFHYETAAKGEMSFRSGDIFHVTDTLYNGVVGSWQVFRVGRNQQQLQKGIVPNKARAEELATAQFNATKKELSASSESRGSFFRRRRTSSRRSKSLGKEHWDDILFSDCVSKFPAYERVVLKHPGFTRPVILFGPIADIARDKMLKDFPDKFISPQLEAGADDPKPNKSSNIIRLSAIRDVISTGKHALLDITPNAVERLNYAQLYPIVVFFKADSKIIIKQLRQGLPKSAHKSSKKLLEQCQKLDKVWGHIFGSTITLNDNTENWYRKVRELIDKQQSGAVWMSESKPEESLSDDFLFPMSSLRLSYASSPESDLEHSPGRPVSLAEPVCARLAKASSDPSVAAPPGDGAAPDALPPYQPAYDSRYGFAGAASPDPAELKAPAHYGANVAAHEYHKDSHKRQPSGLLGHFPKAPLDASPGRHSKEGLYGTAPDLPPRVDRNVKPASLSKAATVGRSAHERLFGTKAGAPGHEAEPSGAGDNKPSSLERRHNSKSDSLSSYDSFHHPNAALHKQSLTSQRLGPNAHDDLKSSIPKVDGAGESSGKGRHGGELQAEPGLKAAAEMLALEPRGPPDPRLYGRSPSKPKHLETRTDYGKYSRNNSSAQEYARHSHQDLTQAHLSVAPGAPAYLHSPGKGPGPPLADGPPPHAHQPYKPVPPPKPKNYKPPFKNQQGYGVNDAAVHNGAYQHGKSHSNPVNDQRSSANYYYNMPAQNDWHTETAVRYGGHGHYDMGGGGGGHYEARRHASISYASRADALLAAAADGPLYGDGAMDRAPNIVDLQGSREQRGSAFELYRKPVHHNLSTTEDESRAATNPSPNPALAPPDGRDVTSAVLDHAGGVLLNEYWGVSLEVPPGALPSGVEQHIYFVITDPRASDHAPPLDLENGETMLSPLVMCGPQGTEFLKPVILNIPHYANTLPSMGISLKATDSEKDIHTDWDNILLPSNHAANSVAVKVDHF